MPYVLDLPRALKAEGLDVEVVPGWQARGNPNFNPGGAVCHWTAGPKTGDRPSLKVCIDGRPGLDGPLCNTFLPRGLTVATQKVYVVAAGRANHAGKGGWKGLVGNSAVFGTEAENSGSGEWTAWQRWAYPRINAAYARLGGFGPEMVCGHNEWAPTRKIDIRDWPMSSMRSQVKTLLAGKATPNQEVDMTPEERAWLKDIHSRVMPYLDTKVSQVDEHVAGQLLVKHPTTGELVPMTQAMWSIWTYSFESFKLVADPAAFAAQLAPKLDGKTDAAAVEAALRKVLGESKITFNTGSKA